MTLNELLPGENCVVLEVGGTGSLRQHFLDMGLIPGVEISVVKFAPLGDPMEIQLHGYELTLRLDEGAEIVVKKIPVLSRKTNEENVFAVENPFLFHPGLGEDGKYHLKTDGEYTNDGKKLTFALVGNQNCGKTTLFNRLTGSNQHVGNFPGVTVDKKAGVIKGHPEAVVIDLPGIYSMSPYSSEEIVSRNFVIDEKPDAIINIVDATNIERNLYLTMQLLEMNVPVVVALNMMDELMNNNGVIDINGLEKLLGVPVVPVSAVKNQGVQELINHAVHIARYGEKPVEQDYCREEDHNGAIHRGIHGVAGIIAHHCEKNGLPVRFSAAKMIEGDRLIQEKLSLDENEKEMIEHAVIQMEKETGMDRCAAIAGMRFDFIERICRKTVKKPEISRERRRSEKIDRILTGKWTAIPCFAAIMAGVFFLTFNVIGSFLQEILAKWIDSFAQFADSGLSALGVNPNVKSLVTDGIIQGVGSVLSFLPVIITLFFFLSLMEDSGYIARVAFFMDKLLRKIGLSGRSIVPLLIGFGCTVPAVMATRILPSRRDRRMTILLTPFMSCSAKLPVYSFFVSAFFPGKGGLIMTGLYFLGILMGIITAFVFKSTLFKGEAVPFVMELPDYRFPGLKNTALLLWDKAKDFLTRAFTVILVASVALWFLQRFDLRLNPVDDSSKSIMAFLSSVLVPLFKPVGLGDWRIITSLLTGVLAKETVVSSMALLFGSELSMVLNTSAAASLLVFSLLYSPCVAAVASIRRELGVKWAMQVVVFQCVLAWIASFFVHLI